MSALVRPSAVAPRARFLRSAGAVAAAFVLMAVITGLADQLLHTLGIFPPWGQVTYRPVPYLIAVAYRVLLGIGGGYLAARWAPHSPRRHAMWLGLVGTALCFVAVVVALTRDVGPVWYPVLLLVFALPAAWLGGALYKEASI